MSHPSFHNNIMKYSEVRCVCLSILFRPGDGPGGASQWLAFRCALRIDCVGWVLLDRVSLTVITVSSVWLGVVIFIVLVWMSWWVPQVCSISSIPLTIRSCHKVWSRPVSFASDCGWFPRFILFDHYIVPNTKWRKASRRKVMIVLLSLLSIDNWSSNSGRADGFRSE